MENFSLYIYTAKSLLKLIEIQQSNSILHFKS